MIQFLLILLGFLSPGNHTNETVHLQISQQSSSNLNEDMDTGGETLPILPPKK